MTSDASRPPLAGRILAGLILVLPFEPRHPVLPILGLQFTLLETVAAAATIGLAWSVRERLTEVLRRPPLPVACLFAFVAVHFVSAAVAPAHRAAAAVYSLRMAAAACLAAVVAASAPRDVQRALRAVVPMAGAVAALALLEGAGVRALDPALNLFRAAPHFFERSRRASAATESPNLAASWLADGLIASAGLTVLAASPARHAALRVVPLAAALSLTYSRGGLAAALVGGAIVLAALGRDARRASLPIVASFIGVVVLFLAGDDALRRRLLVDRPDDARYEPMEARLMLAPDEERAVSVRVVNTGSSTWRASAHRLTCTWYDRGRFLDTGCQAALPATVAPGESLTLTATARAPTAEGTYFLVWNVVDVWGPFSFQGIQPGLVPAAVTRGGTAVLPADPPTIVAPRSRGRLWKLAWSMWRERPLIGFGPDNFRKLRPPVAGWSSSGEGSSEHAHSAYLEAAACTGALGLATFLATLAATLVFAHRALRGATQPDDGSAAAIVLGLMAGIATQASVDFLLGFTSQYLFFGFVVGASAALARHRTASVSAPTAAA